MLFRKQILHSCIDGKITGNTSGSGIGNGTAPLLVIIYEKVVKNPVNFTKNLLTTEVGTSILLKRARKGASIILLRKR